MAAPAFGFSVGDFVNTVQLLAQIINALRASSAAPDECRQAVVFLETVQHTLHKVQDLQLVGGDTEAFQRIHACTQACCDQVIQTLHRARQYDAVLARAPESGGSGGPRIRFRRNKAKVKWSLALKDDLAQLMAVITPQISTVQLILQVADTKIIRHILETTQRNQLQLDLVEARLELDANTGSERENQSAPPPAPLVSVPSKGRTSGLSYVEVEDRKVRFGIEMSIKHAERLLILLAFYIWRLLSRFMLEAAKLPQAPTTLLDSNIILTDALGRTLSLPYEHFSNWSMVLARLDVAFRGCPGEARVASDRFRFYNLREKSQWLHEDNWGRRVSPGMKVFMVFFVGAQGFGLGDCQRCGRGYMKSDHLGWATCPGCDLRHKLLGSERYYPRRPISPPYYMETSVSTVGTLVSAAQLDQRARQDQRELQAYKFVEWTASQCADCDALFLSVQAMIQHRECQKGERYLGRRLQ